MPIGVPIGLRELHYAKLTSDAAGGVVYGVPVKIAGAISANINPNGSVDTLFGDDAPLDSAATLGKIEVELSAASLSADVIADLLGHSVDEATGIISSNAEDKPPWVALGFKSLKSNGKYKYVWLLKGKFSEPEANHETKKDSVTFQPPTLKGAFVQREYDGDWKREAEEDGDHYVAATGTNWFITVPGATNRTEAPTVDTATFAAGSVSDSTQISSLVDTNAAFFKIFKQAGAFDTYYVGDAPIAGATVYVQGTDIADCVAGQHIGVFSMDQNAQILAFTDHTLIAGDIQV